MTGDHSTRAHSEFPASSAKRLIACPGSFRLSKQQPPGVRRSSIYSAEGTAAHEICEEMLAGTFTRSSDGSIRNVDGFDIEITGESSTTATCT